MGRMVFKIGKTYACANGRLIKVTGTYDCEGFIGKQEDGDPMQARDPMQALQFVYENDGRPRGTGFAEWTIISEFEPKGPREITDPEYDQFGGPRPVAGFTGAEIARRIKEMKTTNLGPKHENVTDRLDSLERHIKGHVVSLNALNQRIAKSDETHALDVTATDARLDRLSGIINEYEQRLGALEQHRATARTIIEAMDECLLAQARRLEKLENLPGLATLNRAVVDMNDRLDRFALEIASKATARERDNPAVIGRWVNIYKTPSGDVVAGFGTFSSQWAADQAAKQDTGNRVACIQINEAFG